jgi:predicted RNA-binding Zn ribbon-like protein
MSKKLVPEFDLSGGVLCLDFANTVSERGSPKRSFDYLYGYDNMIAFARDEGILTPEEARELLVFSQTKPKGRARVHRAAITLREAIYRVFSAQVKSQEALPKDVKMIEDFTREASQHRHLNYSEGHYRWEWKPGYDERLGWVLWPIAESAVELLISAQLKKVRTCAGAKCEWLFLDESRNHSRRWCDMRVCGNREKAKRHYGRQK